MKNQTTDAINRKIKLGFYRIDSYYTDYLRTFQRHVQDNNLESHDTPWIGLIIQLGGFDYFVPLTSDAPNTVKSNIVSHRIEPIKSDGTINYLGGILFFNMIPVPKGLYTKINFEKELELRPNYSYLLQEQYAWINIMENKETIIKKAINLYESRYTNDGRKHLYNTICLDFKLLEKNLEDFIKTL